MDEGRLAVVFRQEEQHRKFVHLMNDVVRTRLGLYHNYLSKEHHDTSLKLIKNCAEVRKSVVRQNVLKKCLEMRKRTIVARDPLKRFGQYGGKPLWAMSRDIDRVIASNHPKLRRMKRVEEAMRHSLESGAILDEEAVARRMEAFFQLKRTERHKPKDANSPSPEDIFKDSTAVKRRNVIKPPSWVDNSSSENAIVQGESFSESAQPESKDPRKPPHHLKDDPIETTLKENGKKSSSTIIKRPSKGASGSSGKSGVSHPNKYSELVGVVSNVSLSLDAKGRLQGINTIREDVSSRENVDEENGKLKTLPSRVLRSPKQRSERMSRRRTLGSEDEEEQVQQDSSSDKPRSKLVLPPIESTKAMVSRH